MAFREQQAMERRALQQERLGLERDRFQFTQDRAALEDEQRAKERAEDRDFAVDMAKMKFGFQGLRGRKPLDESKELAATNKLTNDIVKADRIGQVSVSEWGQFLGQPDTFARMIANTQRSAARAGDEMSLEEAAIENAGAGLVDYLLAVGDDGRPTSQIGGQLLNMGIDAQTADQIVIGRGSEINSILGEHIFPPGQDVTFTDAAMAAILLKGNPQDALQSFTQIIMGSPVGSLLSIEQKYMSGQGFPFRNPVAKSLRHQRLIEKETPRIVP